MRTLEDILYYNLCDLTEVDFKRFKDKLSTFCFADKHPIPRGRLESKDVIDTKNLIIDLYGEKALELTIQVLQDADLMGCAEKIQEEICTHKIKQEKNVQDCKIKYMETMKEKYKRIQDKNARLGEMVHLARRYTNLLMIRRNRNKEEREHEMTSTGLHHLQIMDSRASGEYSQTSIEALFDPGEYWEIPGFVVLQGPAGIGKTMAVQKIMLDWASGNLYQATFNYVFCVSCRGINNITSTMSFAGFISRMCQLKCSDIMMKAILEDSKKILFIIDGFDELKWQLQEETEVCDDPFQETSVEILLNRLLRKHIMEQASILITTRPFTLETLRKCVPFTRNVEIMGFTGETRKEYFYNFFEKKEQADMALTVITENDTLFTMCRVPITCWIVCTVMKLEMEKSLNISLYKTTTSVYLLYLKSLIKYHKRDSSQCVLSCVKKLCALAKDGIWEQKILFEEEDLTHHGLTESEIESLFRNENVFQRDIEYYTCYSFIHLSIQEFFAALYYVLIEDKESSDHPQDLLSYREVMGLINGLVRHLFPLTGQFLSGLCGKDQEKEMEKLLGCKFPKGPIFALEEWLRKTCSQEDKTYNVFTGVKYLHEMQDAGFVGRMMGCFLQMSFSNIEMDHYYREISYCLMNSPRDDHKITFSRCNMNTKCLKMLAPALCKCTEIKMTTCGITSACCEDLSSVIITNKSLVELNLSNNNLQDSGVKYVCDALTVPHCNLQDIRLYNCGLTSACCDYLCTVIMMRTSLITLHLSNNKLQDSGVEQLCDGLSDPGCNLQELRLSGCDLTSVCCQYLSSALCNNSLNKLYLTGNSLKDAGIKHLCDGLTNPNCTLRELRLCKCDLTSICCEDLRSVIIKNKSLIKLDLSGNCLQEQGVKLVCDGLTHPDCTLQELRLYKCGLTSACCEDLQSVIITNRSLVKLDLGCNNLQDSGVKCLCDGLIHPTCTLQELRFSICGFTECSCAYLVTACMTNTSLIKLDLEYNYLHQSAMKRLFVHPWNSQLMIRICHCGLVLDCCKNFRSAAPNTEEVVLSLIQEHFWVNCFCDGLTDLNSSLRELRLEDELIHAIMYEENFIFFNEPVTSEEEDEYSEMMSTESMQKQTCSRKKNCFCRLL
ncbi:NACHT, LRR and PYD domains-containing protein 3-like [Discoglossus pictus]